MKPETSKRVAKIASRVLDNPKASEAAKTVAASALDQSKNSAQTTSAKVAAVASKILQDNRFGKDAKSLAGSVLEQRKKD